MADNPDRWLMECAVERIIKRLAQSGPSTQQFFMEEILGAARNLNLRNDEGRRALEQASTYICDQLWPELRRS